MLHDIQSRESFLATLDWLLALSRRYDSPIEFGLVHLAFGTDAQEATHLNEFSRRLREAFRKTDLLGRDGNDFWIIVPYTPATEKIYDKVLTILASADDDRLHLMDRATSIFTLSELLAEMGDDMPQGGSAALLTHLKQHRKAYAKHSLELPSLARVNDRNRGME